MTGRQALAFVQKEGVVLESARGDVPSLAAHVAGRPIRGNWWGHARGGEIFGLTRLIRNADDVLVCRLVAGKITYVHRRLWPALVRVAARFPRSRVAKVVERHTAAGHHETREVPFPRWVPAEVRRAASELSDVDAVRQLGPQLVPGSSPDSSPW